jgi:hypothetical protein
MMELVPTYVWTEIFRFSGLDDVKTFRKTWCSIRSVCRNWMRLTELPALVPKTDTPVTRLALILSIRCNKIAWIKELMNISAIPPEIDVDGELPSSLTDYPYTKIAEVNGNLAIQTAIQYKRLEAARILIEEAEITLHHPYLLHQVIQTNQVEMMRLFLKYYEKNIDSLFLVKEDTFSLFNTIIKHMGHEFATEFLRWVCAQDIDRKRLAEMILHPCVFYTAVELRWNRLVKTLFPYAKDHSTEQDDDESKVKPSKRKLDQLSDDDDTSSAKKKRKVDKQLDQMNMYDLIHYIVADSGVQLSIIYHDGTPTPVYHPINRGCPEMLMTLLKCSDKYDKDDKLYLDEDTSNYNYYDEYDYEIAAILWSRYEK